MSFLAIKPGFSVNIKDIVAVERDDEGIGSIIYLQNNQFSSVIPYETVLFLLGQREEEEEDKFSSMTKSLKTLETNSQIFGG